MQKQSTIFGGAMIIAGTIIGAGMLANPTATAGVWFLGSLLVLVYTWFSMLTSGLMILEVNTHYPHGANFDTMVKDLLGQGWNVVNGFAVAFVLYLLTYAYIFVGGDLTVKALVYLFMGNDANTEALNGTYLWVGQSVFFLIFAGCVWLSARAVDRLSTVLLGGMVLSFLWATGGLLHSAQSSVLLNEQASGSQTYWIYAGTALPVCLASFGFHGNVSSLLKYFQGDARKVAKSLWIGTLIALLIYVLWQCAIQGNLPRHAFAPVIEQNGNVSVLIQELSRFVATGSMGQVLQFFSYMAITTSFLGVTLGLFDYLADLFGFDNSRMGRTKTAAITFLPPFICCLCFPLGFVPVMAYVGLAATVWTAIVPALLLRASRRKFGVGTHYRVYGGMVMVVWVFAFGVINIAVKILSDTGHLPVFK